MDLSVAVCEMTSVDSVQENLDTLLPQLEHALKNGARFISFPENSLYLRVNMKTGEKYALQKEGAAFQTLAKIAQAERVVLHLGSVPVWHEGKIHNLTVWIDPTGAVRFPYSKMHLFDIELEGKEPVKESDYYCHGGTPAVIEMDGFKFGLTICYDLRFPELFSKYREEGADVLLIPAAFLVETGRAHWEVLLRARAIENQCYVLAAAQGGVHADSQGYSRKTYGHSMIVDPWGRVLGEVTEADDHRTIFATLSKASIDHVRTQIPMHDHRRLSPNWS